MPQKLKENSILYLFGKEWRYSETNRKNIVRYCTLSTIANIVETTRPMIILYVMNRIQNAGGINENNIQIIEFLLSLLFISSVGLWSFHGLGRVIERWNAFVVKTNYRLYLVGGILGLPMQWHTNHHSGDTIDKVSKATARIESFSEETFQIIQSIVRLVGAFVALLYFNPISFWVALVTVIINLNIIARFDKVLVAQYYTLSRNENVVAEKVQDAITNIVTVSSLRIAEPLLESIRLKILETSKLVKKNFIISETKWFLISILGNLMLVLTLISYVRTGLYGGVVLYGTIFALYGYITRINEVFYTCASLYSNIIKQRVSVTEAEDIAHSFKEKNTNNLPIKSSWQELEIKSLNFSYHNDESLENLHLDDVSMSIKRGEKIVLVGDSGGGKTTFLNVFRQFYDPQRIDIYCDGEKLHDDFSSISPDVSLIPQRPEIFQNTIGYNITIGVETDQSLLDKAVDMSCLRSVIDKLPRGFDSTIKEDGGNLSGGEIQRLALARGLLASMNKSIVLLDESTSSVDVYNELIIYKNILREFSDKTIIASIHKMYLLPLFDKIYFFRDGRIIVSGTLQELLRSSEEFCSFWRNSKQKEVEDSDDLVLV